MNKVKLSLGIVAGVVWFGVVTWWATVYSWLGMVV
jgi:hypothetical protein